MTPKHAAPALANLSSSSSSDCSALAPNAEKLLLSAPVELARDLVRIESITPNDNGCQRLLADRLKGLGFVCEDMKFEDVNNLWAVRHGSVNIPDEEKNQQQEPMLVFAGHTDVVPPGPLEEWTFPPFEGAIDDDGTLYGRGVADMKGGIACFVVACERFLANHPHHKGSIGLLITSDEEGIAENGTKRVVEELQRRGEKIDLCIVGEPTSKDLCGDTIKIGRRGSLGGELTIFGKQGHIAYPHLADNPLHSSLGALKDLVDMEFDDGNVNFPPTVFQISNINGGTGATNVIPGHKSIHFNFRYSPETSDEELKQRVEKTLYGHGLKYKIEWEQPAYPYETKQRDLAEAARESIRKVAGHDAHICTSGGTSDGRFIATTGAQVIELGLLNSSIHQIDERVASADLETLTDTYYDLLERTLV